MGMLEAPISAGNFECSDCKRDLPATEYYWHKRGHRHSCACKSCYQIKRRAYQINYMATVGKAKARSRYSPEKRSEQIVKSYGLTLEKYELILALQGGGCAICKSKEAKTKRNGRFCVDHDHQTGEVRGLLCAPCNRGIGLLQDKIEVLESATNYLKNHQERSRRAWDC